MSLSLDFPTILQQLRRDTHLNHEALEQNKFNQSLVMGTVTVEETAHFLSKLYGFLQPYEHQLRQQNLESAWTIERRCRAHLILADLSRLPVALPLPACASMPPLQAWPELLGAMYVIEGSTLGGQVITRQLAKAGIPLRTYFTGYAEQTGPMWKTFCQLLTAAATPENQARIVQSASLTFQKLHAWIEQS